MWFYPIFGVMTTDMFSLKPFLDFVSINLTVFYLVK